MRELKLTRKKLNPDNKAILYDIRTYIYAKGVNEKILKEIELDVAGMLLESQERGEDAGEAIGEDYKAFCDELIKNCPRKKPIDYVIYIMLAFSIFSITYVLFMYVVGTYYPLIKMYVEGFILHCTVIDSISIASGFISGMVGSMVLAPIKQKNSFKKGKGCLVIFSAFILYLVVHVMAIHYVRNIVDVNQMVSINLLTVGIASVLTAAAAWGVIEWRKRYQLSNYKKTS